MNPHMKEKMKAHAETAAELERKANLAHHKGSQATAAIFYREAAEEWRRAGMFGDSHWIEAREQCCMRLAEIRG